MSENKETIIMENVTCPKCGSHIFDKPHSDEGLYQCANIINGSRCNTIAAAFCKGCNEILPAKMFGKHGDVMECRECGRTNWPYTDNMREIQLIKDKYNQLMNNASNFLKGFGDF